VPAVAGGGDGATFSRYTISLKNSTSPFSQCGRRWGQWSEVKEWRMGKERRPTWGWEVWLAVWAGAVISLIAILLYCLVLDIDTPDIKPRYEYVKNLDLRVEDSVFFVLSIDLKIERPFGEKIWRFF
jgi:hypothetical protein